MVECRKRYWKGSAKVAQNEYYTKRQKFRYFIPKKVTQTLELFMKCNENLVFHSLSNHLAREQHH